MKKKFITQVGDTDQCFIMLKIGSKNYDFSESPKFEKAIELINNKLWGMIK